MPKGEWYRWDKKTTTEDVHSLDIRRLGRQDDGFTIIMWRDGGSLHCRHEIDCIVLDSHRQTIHLDQTPCNYGGNRRWFLCPSCNKRVGVLYEVEQRFKCRHCHDLPYSSQREGEVDRLLRKVRKIRRRLGASDDLSKPILVKPKGMHWKTFERFKIEEEAANTKSVLAMGRRFGIC